MLLAQSRLGFFVLHMLVFVNIGWTDQEVGTQVLRLEVDKVKRSLTSKTLTNEVKEHLPEYLELTIISTEVADKKVRFGRQKQLISYLISIGGSIKDVPGGAIGSAARSGNLHLVSYLKSLGADVDEHRGDSKISALYYIAERAAGPSARSWKKYWLEASRVLLAHGADPNLLNGRGEPEVYAGKPITGERATTVMHRAAYDGNLDLLKLYLRYGGKVNRLAQANHTPIYDAAMAGKVEIVKYLLSKGADPTITSGYGFDALGIAKRRGHVKVAKLIEAHLSKQK
jgi:ankyrin repeat protein